VPVSAVLGVLVTLLVMPFRCLTNESIWLQD
jgi:hypothetical protein